jgi:hypothetical protein
MFCLSTASIDSGSVSERKNLEDKERNERERERNVDERRKLSYRPSQNRVRKRKIYLYYEVPSSIRDWWKAIDMIGLEES